MSLIRDETQRSSSKPTSSDVSTAYISPRTNTNPSIPPARPAQPNPDDNLIDLINMYIQSPQVNEASTGRLTPWWWATSNRHLRDFLDESGLWAEAPNLRFRPSLLPPDLVVKPKNDHANDQQGVIKLILNSHFGVPVSIATYTSILNRAYDAFSPVRVPVEGPWDVQAFPAYVIGVARVQDLLNAIVREEPGPSDKTWRVRDVLKALKTTSPQFRHSHVKNAGSFEGRGYVFSWSRRDVTEASPTWDSLGVDFDGDEFYSLSDSASDKSDEPDESSGSRDSDESIDSLDYVFRWPF